MLVVGTLMANAQTALKKVYDETIDPMQQIDKALVEAQALQGKKYVMCQVGGNWCPWCLRFAAFISTARDIAKVVADNFIYLHVNYNPRKSGREQQVKAAAALMQRLGNPQRFGFPVFVLLDTNGKVLHIQDSSFLEEGKGYDKEKVLRFFKAWTPQAVNGNPLHNAGFLDIEIHSS
jgi:thioredoxin-related protein